MEMQVSKVLGVYDICTSLLSNKEENHKESNFINMKANKQKNNQTPTWKKAKNHSGNNRVDK